MAKTFLKKTVSHFNKEDGIYIQKDNGNYYVCDGKTILKLTEYGYVLEFFAKYPLRFPKLEEGKAVATKKRNEVHDGIDTLPKLLTDMEKKAEYEAKRTSFTYELNSKKKTHIYKAKEMVFLDADYDEMITEIFPDILKKSGTPVTVKGSTEKNPIIVSQGETEFCVLPINVARQDVIDEFMNCFN